eukprot:scaffold6241_cov129-Cylindrotheca_fusiformis.AAC.19
MYGLVYEIFEDWVLEKKGTEAWHSIKKKAGCDVNDKSFVTRTCYNYDMWIDLISAAADVLDSTFDDILEAYGQYNIRYHFSHGYDALLKCQGSTLRQWLSNLNAMHDHIQKSFPGGNFCPPVFWCEDSDDQAGCIILHYYSQRGNRLVPWVVGIVKELASCHFKVEINMDRLCLQDQDGSKFTTWRVSAIDETKAYKLSPTVNDQRTEAKEMVNLEADMPVAKCPFSRKNHKPEAQDVSGTAASRSKCPYTKNSENTSDPQSIAVSSGGEKESVVLSQDKLKEIFPFHIVVKQDFTIVQVGLKLPQLLGTSEADMCERHVGDFLQITRPVLVNSWDWKSMSKLSDQNFFLSAAPASTENEIQFKGSIVELSQGMRMFGLSPEAHNISDLNRMGLTMSDLPLQSNQRDAVFLGEYVTQEANKAHKLDKLSRKLDEEQKLSATLLHSIIPSKVADELRKGNTVEPAHHEKVTLFFSDIVGFTKICDQVEPWAVIDMMNQLYSIMDFLASHFGLYKVETVGDSYMCCSGLPEPDEYHAEKVANFALAVVECTKHVKSPVDDTPIKLRVGIHTGSCTSGVVGTMTPHYCLFGDMVNTTSRHESTGMAGKIHCSRMLYTRLTDLSQSDSPQYNFRARGLVNMKGKGEHYTYWLESSTESNMFSSPAALTELSRKSQEMIESKAWKMRKYFRRRGGLVRDDVPVNASSAGIDSSIHDSIDDNASRDHRNAAGHLSKDTRGDSPILETDGNAVDTAAEDRASGWRGLEWPEGLSQTESALKMFDILSSSFKSCIKKEGQQMRDINEQLCKFVMRVATLHNQDITFHNFNHTTQVFTRAIFLKDRYDNAEEEYCRGSGLDPWDRFVLLFSALIQCMKHEGVTNAQLEREKSPLCQVYEGKGSYHQRYSITCAFDMLEDEYGELYEEIVFGCPNFRTSVRKTIVSADTETGFKLSTMLANYDRIMQKPRIDHRVVREQKEANLGLILAIASVGHYSQGDELFLSQNQLHFQEQLEAYQCGREGDPRHSWYGERLVYLNDVFLPLVLRLQKILPNSTFLEDGTRKNIQMWEKNGKDCVAAGMLPSAQVRAILGDREPSITDDGLIASNVDMLELLLKNVVAIHQKKAPVVHVNTGTHQRRAIPFEEIQLALDFKPQDLDASEFRHKPQLSPQVRCELRELVISIAAGYDDHKFHNFLHASHVAHLVHLLVTGIHANQLDDASQFAHDPLARFAIVLSALVHDIGHTGVPNGRLADEKPDMAQQYQHKSIAEQNSIDTAWDILMADSFQHLRHSLFESPEEKERLRQLLINCVIATDIFDEDLKAIRQSRWAKVFHHEISCPEAEVGRYKATLVIEHIMQASDVAHTMQDWEIYRHWNERLFNEMYDAFIDGRESTDPSEGWYEGELWFFDNWVIPLAQNLKECGVLDVVSKQLVRQAAENRKKWEAQGMGITQAMVEKARVKGVSPSHSSVSLTSVLSSNTTQSESILTSQCVAEIETLSRVVQRYEQKMKAACGNLIAIVHKGKPGSKELKDQPLSKIHSHLKRQEWYRFYSDDSFSTSDASKTVATSSESGEYQIDVDQYSPCR